MRGEFSVVGALQCTADSSADVRSHFEAMLDEIRKTISEVAEIPYSLGDEYADGIRDGIKDALYHFDCIRRANAAISTDPNAEKSADPKA